MLFIARSLELQALPYALNRPPRAAASFNMRVVYHGKVIAVLNRPFLQHRDLVDIFLYSDKLRPDSPARLKRKLAKLHRSARSVAARLRDLKEHPEYHATAIQQVIDQQVETTVARQMKAGGGGRAVLDSALALLRRVCPT